MPGTEVSDARTAYDALTADQQALVTNLTTLEAAEAQIVILQAAKALASAKVTALANLATAFGTYMEVNYTAPNWTTLTGFNTDGITAIDVATDLAGVTSAQNTATVGMSGVSTADTTPDTFTFIDQTGVALSTVIVSNAITVTGINAPTAISVVGGEYSVDGGVTYTATTGTVSVGNTVTVRHTSSASNSTSVDTILTIGGVSDTFTSTTVAPAPTPTPGGGGGGYYAPTPTPTPTPTPIPTPAGQVLGAATFNFTANLQIGAKGDSVTELQKRLTAEGVYSGPITGYFGPLTSAGVKAYQNKYGISQTG
ncbi:MAG: peptidoglycan-binding domain-containing protein, partial [Candidatus Subteraquimicrobiales bacterium]|nr:peptidoglycan-binding domain-containing protein [Candidatus Subteraquimicrobiales bacterium]